MSHLPCLRYLRPFDPKDEPVQGVDCRAVDDIFAVADEYAAGDGGKEGEGADAAAVEAAVAAAAEAERSRNRILLEFPHLDEAAEAAVAAAAAADEAKEAAPAKGKGNKGGGGGGGAGGGAPAQHKEVLVGSALCDGAGGGAGTFEFLAVDPPEQAKYFTVEPAKGATKVGEEVKVTFSFVKPEGGEEASQADRAALAVRVGQWNEATFKCVMRGGFVPEGEPAEEIVDVVVRGFVST
jgi:hypothetical protein